MQPNFIGNQKKEIQNSSHYHSFLGSTVGRRRDSRSNAGCWHRAQISQDKVGTLGHGQGQVREYGQKEKAGHVSREWGTESGQQKTALITGKTDYQRQKRAGQSSKETRAGTGQWEARSGSGGHAGKSCIQMQKIHL